MTLKINGLLVNNQALFRRFIHYSLVGVSTYLFDLFLIFIFKEFLYFPDAVSVGLGFLIAVSVNFLISYHWVFRGTEQSITAGYAFFVGLAIAGLVVIVSSTLLIQSLLQIELYYARTIVAGIVGSVNFLINTFFNFKMPY